MMQKFKLVERTMQSNQIIASSNSFEYVLNMMQSNQTIASPLSMLSKQVFPIQKMMQS